MQGAGYRQRRGRTPSSAIVFASSLIQYCLALTTGWTIAPEFRNNPRVRAHFQIDKLSCEAGGRGETDAMFEMREETLLVQSVPADETAGIFVTAKMRNQRPVGGGVWGKFGRFMAVEVTSAHVLFRPGRPGFPQTAP